MKKQDMMNAAMRGSKIKNRSIAKEVVQGINDSGVFDILPELRTFLRVQEDHEFDQLKENIREEKIVRDPLIAFVYEGQKILLDGHHRWRAIQELKAEGVHVPYKVNEQQFSDLQEAKNWMIDNQLGRRNLNDSERMYLIGLRYNQHKGQQGGNQSQGKVNQAQLLAEEHNMTDRSVKNASVYAKGLDKIAEKQPEIKPQILSGKLKMRKGDIQAVGKGEMQPEVLLGNEQKVSPSPTSNAVTFSPEQQEKVDVVKRQFIKHAKQLEKAGLDKKQIRSVWQEALKEL